MQNKRFPCHESVQVMIRWVGTLDHCAQKIAFCRQIALFLEQTVIPEGHGDILAALSTWAAGDESLRSIMNRAGVAVIAEKERVEQERKKAQEQAQEITGAPAVGLQTTAQPSEVVGVIGGGQTQGNSHCWLDKCRKY